MQCPKCGYVRQAHDQGPAYECPRCGVVYAKVVAAEEMKGRIAKALRTRDWTGVPRELVPPDRIGEAVNCIPVTTTLGIPGRETAQAIDVISAECAYGMNIFKDIFTDISDVVGGRSATTQNTLRSARQRVMTELRAEAFSLGADAVIGVSLAYSEFSGSGKSMLLVVATGTAVKLA